MKTFRLFSVAVFCFLLLNFVPKAHAQNEQTDQNSETRYQTVANISYLLGSTPQADSYRRERCVLDVYYPENKTDFATIVWFHGGGLEGGEKYIPQQLLAQGVAVLSVNYRLSPRVQHPAYLQDAAEALAWTFANIEKYGGNRTKIFVSGHSAGGYLALMLGLAPEYLAAHGVDHRSIAALFPISGQCLTHYTIRKELKTKPEAWYADRYAPIFHASTQAPLTVLLTGDRSLELAARYEENALLHAQLLSLGAQQAHQLFELKGFDHGTVVAPACLLMLSRIEQLLKAPAKP